MTRISDLSIARDIVSQFLDNRKKPLHKIYNLNEFSKHAGSSQTPRVQLFQDMRECVKAINRSPLSSRETGKEIGWNNPVNIGRALYGLRKLPAEAPVLVVLSEIINKINASRAELNGQAIGNALYGLQGMDSSHTEVRQLLKALTTKINASRAELNGQEIGNALYGLQGMDSSHQEVRQLLKALNTKINASRAELNGQAIGNALYGLQGMDACHEEVEHNLTALMNQFPQGAISEGDWHFKVQAQSAIMHIFLGSSVISPSLEGIIDKLFSNESFTVDIDSLENDLIETLKNRLFDKGVLDIHGVDHLSIRLLLNELDKGSFKPHTIIFGKASHSRHAENIPLRLVKEACQEMGFQLTVQADNSGRAQIAY